MISQEEPLNSKKIPLVSVIEIYQLCKNPQKSIIMQISIKEDGLTVTKEIYIQDGMLPAESAMLAAYDVLSRVFGQASVIRAYENTDPDTMDIRS